MLIHCKASPLHPQAFRLVSLRGRWCRLWRWVERETLRVKFLRYPYNFIEDWPLTFTIGAIDLFVVNSTICCKQWIFLLSLLYNHCVPWIRQRHNALCWEEFVCLKFLSGSGSCWNESSAGKEGRAAREGEERAEAGGAGQASEGRTSWHQSYCR